MLTLVLAALMVFAQQADPETLPPPPTEAEMLAEFSSKFPDARLVGHEALPLSDGRSKICGTAEISGQVEPFAVLAQEGNRASVVVTLAGQQPPARAPGLLPRHWDINVISPGRWTALGASSADPAVRGLDASSRQLALRVCPTLQPPAGVVWRTEIEQN